MVCDNTESGDVQSDRILTPLLGECVSIEFSLLAEVSQRSVIFSTEVSVAIPLAGAHSRSFWIKGVNSSFPKPTHEINGCHRCWPSLR